MVVPLASAQKETRMSTLLRNLEAQFLIPVDDNNCFWSEEDGQEQKLRAKLFSLLNDFSLHFPVSSIQPPPQSCDAEIQLV